MTTSNTTTALPSGIEQPTTTTTPSNDVCIACARSAAVFQLMTVRHGKSKKRLKAAVKTFGESFQLCACHALERYDAAVNKIATGGTEQDRVKAVIAELERMNVSDLASQACSRQEAEGWDLDELDGEEPPGGAAAIEAAEDAEAQLAKIYGLTTDRVQEIVAAAYAVQSSALENADYSAYPYDMVLEDLVRRLKNNDADNCDPKEKASYLRVGGYHGVVYSATAFAKFEADARNLTKAARATVQRKLDAEFQESLEEYRRKLAMSPEAQLADAAQDIAKSKWLAEHNTAESLAETRRSYLRDPSPWLAKQREQLKAILNGSGAAVREDKDGLGYAVYSVLADAIAQPAVI
jgi:hypothetical protein